MSKLKEKYFEIVMSIPERAFLEINKQIISALCIYIILFVILLFSQFWTFAVILSVAYLAYMGLLFYEMHLFKVGEIIEIKGICTAVDKDIFPYVRNYIFVATGEQAYKVIIRKKKKVTVGSEILVYARKNTLMKQEAFIQVNNSLMFFVLQIATSV